MANETFVPPKAPKDLCFNEINFVQTVFDTDKFLQEHKANVSLEKLRDDLGIYLKILRSAMIELINRDYTDFVSLSSNLIGLDQAINNLATPLGQLKEEVKQVKQCLDDTITDMTNNLDKYQNIRDKRQSIHSLIRFHKSITKLADILSSCDKNINTSKPDVLERAAMQFNQLKFHFSRCQGDLSSDYISKMSDLDEQLKHSLSLLLVSYVKHKDILLLERCLRIYISLDKVKDAEEVVRKKIVVPAVENIISDHTFQNDPAGLKGIYVKLENVLDSALKELLDLTLNSQSRTVKGYNFLINSYWPEIEQRIEDYIPMVFAPGNPELFHKRYRETLNFLLKLEQRCHNEDVIVQFKSHFQYTRFLSKWNLPVYFQIRFQEIAGTAESVFSAAISTSSIRQKKDSINNEEFILHATNIVWDCLLRIWTDDVFLPQLLARFWKLCLQLCSRYQEWCKFALKHTWPAVQVNETNQNQGQSLHRLDFLVGLYTDVEKLAKKIPDILTIASAKVVNLSSVIMDSLNDTINESSQCLKSLLPQITEELVGELLRHSGTHLRQISDIPRLFRRTNREVPTKPCAYVRRTLEFLERFSADYRSAVPETSSHWLSLAASGLTQQYISSVTDVLTSVQKTEESLRRLKKIRDKSAGISTTESQGTSDDEKIRIQLLIDVQSYIEIIKELGLTEAEVGNLNQLLQIVETAAKSKAEAK
ncbi:conserved oligomeric Golgi complex subunit 2 [Trichogramma pretiosum]|uniref:conserved oligomeric Golgi complex subunit 2 n=1 Tax=Trichogramma pretiosum TaxID=7493 RepID=UPI0006C9D45E|nr:conserved oligomeric Golgi complex subunit 2 [Trichogramma pretiosum]